MIEKKPLKSKLVKMARHINMSGLLGGYVATTAKVDRQAEIESGAIVMPGAKVSAGATILRTQFVVPDGTVISLLDNR